MTHLKVTFGILIIFAKDLLNQNSEINNLKS